VNGASQAPCAVSALYPLSRGEENDAKPATTKIVTTCRNGEALFRRAGKRRATTGCGLFDT
jgi:hypothetical protein